MENKYALSLEIQILWPDYDSAVKFSQKNVVLIYIVTYFVIEYVSVEFS